MGHAPRLHGPPWLALPTSLSVSCIANNLLVFHCLLYTRRPEYGAWAPGDDLRWIMSSSQLEWYENEAQKPLNHAPILVVGGSLAPLLQALYERCGLFVRAAVA